VSAGGRLGGAGIAFYIAADQSYDRTQVTAACVAIIALSTLLPLRGNTGAVLAAVAAGLLFFGGSALGKEAPTAGMAMIAAGALGAAGVLMTSRREGLSPVAALAGFFAALPLLIGGVAGIALLVEG
jgi:hypothetical protein